MKLCYGAVFRGTTPLVVFSPEPGNYEKIFIDRCTKNVLDVGKTCLKVDNCLWVIEHDEQDLNILLVVQNTNDRNTVEQFADEIRSRFIRAHGAEWKTAQAHELYTRFEPQFRMVRQMIESASSDKTKHTEVFPPTGIESMSSINDYPSMYSRDATLLYTQKKTKKSCAKWIIAIVIILIIVYFALVYFCGGFTLQPKCIPPSK